MEHEEQAEQMEEEAERMEHHSEQLGERIEDVEEDWEKKEDDASVPGAQPDQSDQLPEEETSTGNPDAAGSDE
jgi:hypothetical protein